MSFDLKIVLILRINFWEKNKILIDFWNRNAKYNRR